jgi:hypothetical protein
VANNFKVVYLQKEVCARVRNIVFVEDGLLCNPKKPVTARIITDLKNTMVLNDVQIYPHTIHIH